MPKTAEPGDTLSVSLYGEASQSIAENYVMFVHLLDETGQIAVAIAPSANVPPGAYQVVVVGLYRVDGGE